MTKPLGIASGHAGLELKRALVAERAIEAVDIVGAFLGAAFEGGRHAARVAKINQG